MHQTSNVCTVFWQKCNHYHLKLLKSNLQFPLPTSPFLKNPQEMVPNWFKLPLLVPVLTKLAVTTICNGELRDVYFRWWKSCSLPKCHWSSQVSEMASYLLKNHAKWNMEEKSHSSWWHSGNLLSVIILLSCFNDFCCRDERMYTDFSRSNNNF